MYKWEHFIGWILFAGGVGLFYYNPLIAAIIFIAVAWWIKD